MTRRTGAVAVVTAIVAAGCLSACTSGQAAESAIALTATDTRCDAGQHRAGRRADHLRHHQRRLQGDRGLRLREARRHLLQDRHREGEHRPRHVLRPDRVPAAGPVRGRVQAGSEGRRHQDADHGLRQGRLRRGNGRRRRRPRPSRPTAPTSSSRPTPWSRWSTRSSPPSRPATSRRPSPCTPGRGSRGSGSSRSPRASATSTRGSTCARPTSRPARTWTGWHRLEKALWTDGDLTGLGPVAAQLATDVRELQRRVPTADMTVASIGNGAKELLDEVATGKITGEEEAFSHTDLVDFQANLDGAKKAYDLLRPLVSDAGPVARLDTAFSATAAAAVGAPPRRHLRVLRHRDRGAAARAGPGRRRPRRAALAADRGGRLTVAEPRGLSRRHLIAGAGVLRCCRASRGCAAPSTRAATDGGPDRRQVDFHGAHQAGIATPVQGHLHFASFDVTTTDRAALVALLQDWTAAAREMTADRRVGGRGAQSRLAPPSDTGEARRPRRRQPHAHGRLRAGAVRRPVRPGRAAGRQRWPTCRRSPATRSTRRCCGGDLAVQACSDDPQVAVHAVRNLTRIAAGRAAVRWAQLGFGKASATETDRPDAAQPVRLQGRHRQHPRRRRRRARRARLGRTARDGSDLDGRRLLPGRPPDPDDHRDLGPHLAGRAGDRDRAHQGRRRPARAGRASARRSGRPSCPRPRTFGWRTRRCTAVPGCCAAATTSSTAPTGWATWTPGCSSSPTSATRAGASCRSRPSWPGTTR